MNLWINKEEALKLFTEKENDFVKKIESLKKENASLLEKIGQKQEEIKSQVKRDEFYKFLEREDSFSDVELVKIKDLSHLACTIEFCFQVFEKKTLKYLFDANKNISIQEAELCFQNKLKLNEGDSLLLARYIIEPREQSTIIFQRDRKSYGREILVRLTSIVGAYK